MKVEDIIDQWRTDSVVDDTELDREALNIPILHAKYLKYLSGERLKLRSLKLKLKTVARQLSDYYRGDLNNPDDLAEIGREPWPKTVLKQDLLQYVEADDDMIKLTTKLALQQETVDVCEEIIKAINTRGFQIKNAIDWRRLTNFGQ
jgi:thymidylate synthase